MEWNLVPFVGIACDALTIAFGDHRDAVRERLSSAFGPPDANNLYPDEDDFITPDRSTFIRVRYQQDAVRDVEFLLGSLSYMGVELHDGATLKRVREFLESDNGPDKKKG